MERVRNEISTKNPYWISKHRFLELKHFCLQYPEWKREYKSIELMPPSDGIVQIHNDFAGGSFLENVAFRRIELEERMRLVEAAASSTDEYLGPFIFRAVTENAGYTQLRSKCGMACGKDMFYDRYRKFFWLLHQTRK